MPVITSTGNPDSKIWVVLEKPYERDLDGGNVLSCPYGYVFKKMWKEAQIATEPFITTLKPDTEAAYDDVAAILDFQSEVNKYRPPLLVPMGKRITAMLCPETIVRKKASKNGKHTPAEASLDKYSSSLLNSPFLNYEHYAIPQLPPDAIVTNWAYRDIGVHIDLGRVRDEYNFWAATKSLRPLKSRTLVLEPTYYDLCAILQGFIDRHAGGEFRYISVDIETIRPPKGKTTQFKNHPGYPYTISLADSPTYGLAFSLWDYEPWQLVNIWRLLYIILSRIPQIGQNYFRFDIHFLEALGFDICVEKCQDTLIRHHILWPELEHSLQFLTKQYTRQPYYKDEGKHWTPKQKKQLLHYNALDSTVTYEVFLGQEEEFASRAHLI